MTNEFNANDIFEIAIKIEQNGAIFYRDAANQVKGENHKKFLLDLAKMEEDHKATFANMKKELKDEETFSTTFDPNDENVLYLKALADTRVFFDKKQPGEKLKDILGSALQAEKDSIVFYLGMKALVPAKLGQAKIDTIIKEEMSHIRILAGKLTEYC